MTVQREDPGAIAVAHRVGVTELASRNDFQGSTPTPLDLQVRRVIAITPVSPSLAVVIAVLAFSPGRQS